MAVETPVLVAIITSAASLILAIVNAFTSRRQTLATERAKRKLDLENDEAKSLLAVLKQAVAQAQEFRDAVRMIVGAPEETLSKEAASETLRAIARANEEFYRNSVGGLTPDVAELLHHAKSTMLQAAASVATSEHIDRAALQRVRDDLLAMQNQLLLARLEALNRFS